MFWLFIKSNFRLKPKSYQLKACAGFTLLELIVVIAIFLIITAVVMTDIPNFRQNSALDLTVSEVATYIREAQIYGASQKGGAPTVSSYVIKFMSGHSDFYLYQDTASTPIDGKELNGFTIASLKVSGSSNQICNSANLGEIEIGFKANNYESQIGTQLEPQLMVGGADCGNFSYAEIDIAPLVGSLSSLKCISVYGNGQISPTCNQ